jgi:hydroxyacylglutathione hydrolase
VNRTVKEAVKEKGCGVLVTGFPAAALGTNCYVLAAGPGEQALIVDPGIGVIDRLDEVLAEYRLQPAAVLLTHGHFDHTFSVAPVCGARGITAYVHPADREMLADPMKGMGMSLDEMLGGRFTYTEPDDVAELTDGATLSLAGLEITVDHAPGHTGGSVIFRVPGSGTSWEAEQICLTGDVLFAGSIGRTDLPGGNTSVMMTSLREKILPLADDTVVLPGHGTETTIGRERAQNPYLRELVAAPRRGL